MRTTHSLQRSLRYLLAWAPTIALPRAVVAQQPVSDAVLERGTVSFLGRATVGDFIGTTSRVTGAIIGGSSYSTIRGWVEAPVGTLVTGNEHRDRDLRATMNVDRYPIMHFELARATIVTAAAGAADSTGMTLHGALTIHGVTRLVDVPAAVLRYADTTRVTAHFPLDLFDYDIRGLTRMFGMLRMQREIDVRVDLQFIDRPQQPENP
jgi:polyisoprenoid-binding protein YceI